MATQSSDEARRALAALIEGRSDDEIVEGVQARGVEKVLDQVFEGMVDAFLPAKAGSESAVIQYDIDVGGTTHTYQLAIAGGKCAMAKGAPQKARTTLVAPVPDFLRLITGKLGGVMAFMTGRLKLRGDMLFAQTMQRWFRQG
jgi:putative sterol carrier protein